ncbi:MAG: TIGR03759 family integrating conjugative element protein [Gammaproteobacteria bacterium]|nr:TIGR03759 family integrating conjugative element protein [Gammaproteobacteria bacterium]
MFGQDELDVVQTSIERRTNEALDHTDTNFLDGSHWDLDTRELERAEMLRDGFRRYVSDRQISPLEILGIHARTDSERNRYARHWAELMIEDAERVLAFQRAYDAAVRDLLGEERLVNLTQLPPRVSSTPALLGTDRLAVFVRLDCEPCTEVLARVFQIGRQVDGVDVYVLGLADGDKTTLHAWANRQGIPPLAVHSKRITLNFDDGLLARLHPRADEVPVVMRRRGDKFDPLDPWELP